MVDDARRDGVFDIFLCLYNRAYVVWASALPTLDSIDQKNIRAHATTVR